MKAYELLNDPSKFLRGNFASENSTMFTNPRVGPDGTCKATKWDICGSMLHCYPDNAQFEAVWKRFKESTELEEWFKKFRDTNKKFDFSKMMECWPVFNDNAAFTEIQDMLRKLNI